MAAAAGGGSGGLRIEVDEDVLVENAAAATLFSPGMWVQRPSATPTAPRGAVFDDHRRVGSGYMADGKMLLPIPLPSLVLTEPAAQAGGGTPGRPLGTSAGSASAGADPGSADVGAARSAAELAGDPDLAYLSIADEREKERAEREYLQQDCEHMAALEEAYARLREQNVALEQQLKGVTAAVNDVVDENRTIKALLHMLKVRREDFVFNPQQTIGAQQEAIGMRLLRNMELEDRPGDEQQQQPPIVQQQQQQQQQSGHYQHQQPQPSVMSGAVPLHIQAQQQAAAAQQQQRPQMPGSQGEQQHADHGMAAAAAGFDVSPGGMLPLSTPSILRTVSPKIGAFHSGGDALLGGTMTQLPDAPPPTAIPASPYDFPAEAQIAAAALTAKQGDTAAALLTLLDKAIEGRIERQQHATAAHQQQQLQLLQQHVQQEAQRQQLLQQQHQSLFPF